ncbi:MAG: hypothetical protein HYU77_15510 [Betaproteobacteria bacterium]|nr:hypothetical protein [Betaproteobacteria bacterium]
MKTMPFALKSFFVGTLLAFLPIGAQADCGATGQTPCWRIPPCNADLTIGPDGRCFHPNCGKHNQGACSPWVRLQPCDYGLLPDLAQGAKCVKPSETIAAKEIDRQRRQGVCKAAVTAILSGTIPQELQVLAKSLTQNAAGPTIDRLKSMEVRKAADDFAKNNVPFLKQMADAGSAIKRNRERFRALFAPDKVCGGRTAPQWIAELKALGIDFDLRQLKLSENSGQAKLYPAALRPGSWIIAPLIGLEAHIGEIRTFHAVVLMIPTDGSWSEVLYVPSVSAASGNLFAGIAGGVKVFWPPTSLEEHLPLGGNLALGISPTAIYELIEFFLLAEGIPTPPSIVGADITVSFLWDNLAGKLFKGHLTPGGFGVELALGVEPIPIPATLSGGIEGGVLIYQFP